jgi:hypothetical protein
MSDLSLKKTLHHFSNLRYFFKEKSISHSCKNVFLLLLLWTSEARFKNGHKKFILDTKSGRQHVPDLAIYFLNG